MSNRRYVLVGPDCDIEITKCETLRWPVERVIFTLTTRLFNLFSEFLQNEDLSKSHLITRKR